MIFKIKIIVVFLLVVMQATAEFDHTIDPEQPSLWYQMIDDANEDH